MKRILLMLPLFWAASLAYGQNQARFHHVITQKIIDDANFELQRKFTVKDTSVLIRVVKHKNGVIDTIRSLQVVDLPQKQIMRINTRLKGVITLVGGVPTLDIWQITSSPVTDPDIINPKTPLGGSTFVLAENRKTIGDPTKVIKVPFNAVTWNLSTTPLRYRFRTDSTNATVSSGLSLSVAYGYTFGKTTFTSRNAVSNSITLAPFFGATTADIKKETVTTPKKWENAKSVARTNLAVSYGLSATFARNNLGLVFSGGFDNAIGPKSSQWAYKNKLWLGVGSPSTIHLHSSS